MLALFKSKAYQLVPKGDYDSDEEAIVKRPQNRTKKVLFGVCISVLLSILVVILTWGFQTLNSRDCSEPIVRREWRQISSEDKLKFIKAVQCLHLHPSQIKENQAASRYDDFAWVHSEQGRYIHKTSLFLPFHRYFLHAFEEALRNKCGYTEYLPYWDWTQDWEDPASSIIWDSSLGFGGSGNPVNDDCVEDGPFAKFQVSYRAGEFMPHCLARAFTSDNGTGKFSGYRLRPEAVSKILQKERYGDFLLELETGSHNGIPDGVNGDFHFFTAPNDPVFYLHHVQLDRIWWMWQQQDTSRLSLYRGLSDNSPLSLKEPLVLMGLTESKVVADVMKTESSNLCYRY